jgi:hypothetical protein
MESLITQLSLKDTNQNHTQNNDTRRNDNKDDNYYIQDDNNIEEGQSTQEEMNDENEKEYKFKFNDDSDNTDIKDIITRISKLNLKEKGHILNILKMANVEFTKNSNGYFFNFLDVKPNIIDKICNCLELIEKNADILKEMDRRRNDLLTYYRKIIEDRLHNNIIKRKNEYLNKLHVKQYDNVKLSIKRKPRYKKKILFENINEDPDVMIKEYIKSRTKYEKDSVYHRIMTSIKFIRSNRTREVKGNDDNSDYAAILNKEDNSDYDMADNESVHDITEDNSSFNEEIDPETNDNDEPDNKSEQVKEESEKQEDDESDNGSDVEDDSDDKTDTDFMYYKNILYKQGFEFDDNKNCTLTYQIYIQ